MNIVEILKERGFIDNTTHQQELHDYVNNEKVTCYIGFDPTASSLHIGSLVPIMALAHMQMQGHRPIALVGGGTGLVGDPSGKTEMRKILTEDEVNKNAIKIKEQLSRFIDFENEKALISNNADWLKELNYIYFLRDIGKYFSVNKMIKAESYRTRIDSEEGLSFIEFNYMLLQSYDFLELYNRYNCKIQMGGSDQWGNIVAGIDLIRRLKQDTCFGITFPLIKTSSGEKMGKTVAGAIWLDANKTSPYEYYQYWINTHDSDVVRFLLLFTFLPILEIKEIAQLKNSELNAAKIILAYEATKIAHGSNESVKSYFTSAKMFGKKEIPKSILPSSDLHKEFEVKDSSDAMPFVKIDSSLLKQGISAIELYCIVGVSNSKGEAKRLIEQGGAYVNGKRVESVSYIVTQKDIDDNSIILRSGKKTYLKVIIEE
ncbi:MAG: tyrosine--tRNA ligase [Desulfobacterales bacterium]|nr:tyrosine--tRNA ligase [Desulfobacterales bacterium]